MLRKLGFYTLFTALSTTVIYPLVQLVSLSLKSMQEIFANPLGIPRSFRWSNYVQVWTEARFSTFFANSVLITTCALFLLLFFASMAAFMLARRVFRGQKLIYALFLSGLIIPMRLSLIPLFILFRDLHLVNSRFGLVIAYPAAHMAFAVFLLTNFLRSVPYELEEAAIVDGCGDFGIYARIMLPIARPGLATVGIFSGVAIWNDFFLPLVMITDDRLSTLPLGLVQFVGDYFTRWDLLFTGIALSVAPAIILYLCLSRQFIEGLTAGSLK